MPRTNKSGVNRDAEEEVYYVEQKTHLTLTFIGFPLSHLQSHQLLQWFPQ